MQKRAQITSIVHHQIITSTAFSGFGSHPSFQNFSKKKKHSCQWLKTLRLGSKSRKIKVYSCREKLNRNLWIMSLTMGDTIGDRRQCERTREKRQKKKKEYKWRNTVKWFTQRLVHSGHKKNTFLMLDVKQSTRLYGRFHSYLKWHTHAVALFNFL